MGSNGKEVATEILPYIRAYKDGSVERLTGSPIVPPCADDPETGVSSKDIIVSQDPPISARIYLPKQILDHHQHRKPTLLSCRSSIGWPLNTLSPLLNTTAGPDVKIKGALLTHPYFWGSKPVGSEMKDVEERDKVVMSTMWHLALAGLGCSRLLVSVAGEDLLRDRRISYYNAVKESGWQGESELVVVDGEIHAFHIDVYDSENAMKHIERLASFLIQNDHPAQLIEHKVLNLEVVGSSPTEGIS
ncbi:ARM repeat protein interacting with ABF2 isoform 1 [Hibiscus syriacus]|uniref:ARM repeat protein interacting with ABF2 isoform 1 n=1 Tax=Hibiscus syriacus TaxID=106335 RepID=A0A6A3BLT7_HIBSY|nr:ARM repeat protein interacting with ABF2 isoform 1 [Hibiscus syriacus]